jgi:hypothetical protein
MPRSAYQPTGSMKLSWRAFDAAALATGGGATLGGWDVAAAAVDLDDPAQRRIGDYELLEELGRGGMGVVYRARQRSLDREVALKLLGGSLWTGAEAAARFAAEAASAARMQHPGIVAIHEFGTEGARFFYSMELVAGADLAQRLREQGPLSEDQAARLVRELARAVHYAHTLGVLHLDLKPQNVLLTADGRALIADFGLARPLDRALGHEAAEPLAGTPAYMAPEQALLRAADISRGTDVYGLGAILHECLTGEPPFRAESPEATLRQVVEAPLPAPRARRRTLSRDAEAIVLKCLQRDPAQRYASAEALAEDLGRLLDGNPVQARRLRWAERVWRWLAREPVTLGGLATAATILLAAGAAWMLQFERNERSEQAVRDAFAASAEALTMPAATRARLETLQPIVAEGYPYASRRTPEEQLVFLERLRAAVQLRAGMQDPVARELSLLVARGRMRRDREAWRAALAGSDAPLAWLLGALWYDGDLASAAHGRAVLDGVRRTLAVRGLSDPVLAVTAHLCTWFEEMPDEVKAEARPVCDEAFARARAAAPRNPLFLLLQPEFDAEAREHWLAAMQSAPLDDYGPRLYRDSLALLEGLAPRLAAADLADGLTARDVAALAADALLNWTFFAARTRVLAPCWALEKQPTALNLDHCRRSLAAPAEGWTYWGRDPARRGAQWRLALAERGESVPKPVPELYDYELRYRLVRCCSQLGAHPEWVRLRSTQGERAAQDWLLRELGESLYR